MNQISRMIESCRANGAAVQAVILCQCLPVPNLDLAFQILQESIATAEKDVDSYGECIWEVCQKTQWNIQTILIFSKFSFNNYRCQFWSFSYTSIPNLVMGSVLVGWSRCFSNLHWTYTIHWVYENAIFKWWNNASYNSFMMRFYDGV